MSRNLTDEVRGVCTFEFCRDQTLYYRTANGFSFGVPVAEIGSGTFNREEKGIQLMRWIRKGLQQFPEPETIHDCG